MTANLLTLAAVILLIQGSILAFMGVGLYPVWYGTGGIFMALVLYLESEE